MRTHVDAAQRQPGHRGPGHQGPSPPGQSPDLLGHQTTEESEDRQVDGQVGQQGHESRAHAQVQAHAATDVREERAGVGHLVAHGGIAHAEQQQDQTRQQVGARRGGAVAQQDGGGFFQGHAHQRRSGGDHEEDDADHAQATRTQGLLGARVCPGR